MTDRTIPNCWKVILDPLITDQNFITHLDLVCKAQKSGKVHYLTDSTDPTAAPTSETTTRTELDPSTPQTLDPPTATKSVTSPVPNPDSSIIRHVFHVLTFRGYSGTFDETIIDTIRTLPFVQYVSPVHITSIQAVEAVAHDDCWGLGAISHVSGLSAQYLHDPAGPVGGGIIVVYVVDTGVMAGHTEFNGGRVVHEQTFLDPALPQVAAGDPHGHGTHVAGIIAGNTCGVARFARIVSVKVVQANGRGRDDDTLAGVQWIIGDAPTRAGVAKSIVNMSISGERDYPLNFLICEASAFGILFVAAAGNAGLSNDESPASAHSAISVGAAMMAVPARAVERMDRRPTSNLGPNVDIFAPGHNIRSSWNNGLFHTIGGTSMAAPFVSGVAAYLIARDATLNTPPKLVHRILSTARNNLIRDPGLYSPILFLYNGSGG